MAPKQVLTLALFYLALFVPITLVSVWLTTQMADPFKGLTFSWAVEDLQTTFNWHPILMTLVFSTLFSQGRSIPILSTNKWEIANRIDYLAAAIYRLLPFSHKVNKILHSIIQFFALILAGL